MCDPVIFTKLGEGGSLNSTQPFPINIRLPVSCAKDPQFIQSFSPAVGRPRREEREMKL